MVSFKETVEYIEGIVKFTEKHPLAHTKRALGALGNPEKGFEAVHVAGTNGKGSVCAFLDAIFREQGIRTGLFTSPHIERITERFKIDGCEISEEDFVDCFEAVRSLSERMEREGDGHPSYFEFLFLMACLYFQRKDVPLVVMETGLGGRLDATNVFERPLFSVITSLSMDHMQYLGNTIEEIAGEKAGIIKPGVPVYFSAGDPRTAAVIEAQARTLGAPAVALVPEDYDILVNQGGVIDFSESFRYDNSHRIYRIRSFAPYQAENAALAALAVRSSCARGTLAISEEAVARGLFSMVWQARMEQLAPDVYLDGAHNEGGIRAFVSAAKAVAGERRMVLLFAAVADKSYEKMIRILSEELAPDFVVTTEVPGARRASAGIFRDLFAEEHVPCEQVGDIGKALERALAEKGDGILLIAGSLYLAGHIKEIIHDQF